MPGINKKPIDKSKKANIKCEHCEHWKTITVENAWGKQTFTACDITHEPKNYWNRCKAFKWRKDKNYADN